MRRSLMLVALLTVARPVAASDIPAKLPAAPPTLPARSAALAKLLATPEARRQATQWRRIGDSAVEERQYALACKAYRAEAAIYRRNGDPQGALAQEARAARYDVELETWFRDSATRDDWRRLDTGGRLEPGLGAYLGAFVEHDQQAREVASRTLSSLYAAFARLAGEHPSHFTYLTYGNGFPRAFCDALKRENRIPHLAWEPRSLADVFGNPEYLREFADAVARYDHPVFLRFAGEMNGAWTPYHGNPAEYRRAFRFVADAIHRRAPKAAMVWCPNATPLEGIDAYYPGDDVVDWVGVNLYSVLFYDNDPRRPALMDDPVDLIRPVYARYASRKPIAIGEWGASHLSKVDNVSRPAIAARRIARLYGALPRLFPRLKLMDYYDCDNTRYARAGRQLNNYSLSDEPSVTSAYRAATDDPWYIRGPSASSPVVYRKLAPNRSLRGPVQLSVWVKAPGGSERVYWTVDGTVRYATARPGPAAWVWDTSRETPGDHRVSVLLYDGQSRFVASRDVGVKVVR